jgi:hypothetical protein
MSTCFVWRAIVAMIDADVAGKRVLEAERSGGLGPAQASDGSHSCGTGPSR